MKRATAFSRRWSTTATLTADQEAAAKKAKLKFVNGGVESSAAPYFVDMVKDHLLARFSETDLETQSYRIYTTLDPDLQRAASQAVQIGIEQIDKLLARRYAIWRKKGQPVADASGGARRDGPAYRTRSALSSAAAITGRAS